MLTCLQHVMKNKVVYPVSIIILFELFTTCFRNLYSNNFVSIASEVLESFSPNIDITTNERGVSMHIQQCKLKHLKENKIIQCSNHRPIKT